MTIWEQITQAQANRQSQTRFIEDGQEVQIRILPNGWSEGFTSMGWEA